MSYKIMPAWKIKLQQSVEWIKRSIGMITSIYVVYEVCNGNEVILRWFLTERGATQFVHFYRYPRYGKPLDLCIRDISWAGSTKISKGDAYAAMLKRKNSGKRQDYSSEGFGV